MGARSAQDELLWLVDTPLGDRLQRLVIRDHGRVLTAWWSLCQRLPRLGEVCVGDRPAFRFVRDSLGWRLVISNITNALQVANAVNPLQRALTRVEVISDNGELERADLQRRLLGLDLTFRAE